MDDKYQDRIILMRLIAETRLDVMSTLLTNVCGYEQKK